MAVYESLNMLHMLAPVYFGFILLGLLQKKYGEQKEQ